MSQGPAQKSRGATGAQGPQGSPGVQSVIITGLPSGAMGVTGPQGIQGSPGVTGPRGLLGPQGSPGIRGVTGLQGPQGIAGPPGGSGIAIQQSGVPAGQFNTLDFAGANIVATGGVAIIYVAGGTATGSTSFINNFLLMGV